MVMLVVKSQVNEKNDNYNYQDSSPLLGGNKKIWSEKDM